MLTRLWIVRGLGLIYFNAFLIVFNQGLGLWGDRGLLPIQTFTRQVLEKFGGDAMAAFWAWPSLFYFVEAEPILKAFGWLGMAGGVLMMFGFANKVMLFGLWLMQLSLVNSGQLFYGYGWESQLLEFTFLTFFMVPTFRWNIHTLRTETPLVVLWAMRWMLFRLMLGAGLIKIRGDQCWRDLTCLVYHYETQPNPHPLSYFFHQMPNVFHYGGVLFNHFVELIVPFGLFGPKTIRRWAASLTAIFQIILILSGNLAWLNWLTLLMCIPCFDDDFIRSMYAWLGRKAPALPKPRPLTGLRHIGRWAFAISFSGLIIYLSIQPALNLVSRQQAMNTSYDQWHLINSYGAFGSIGKVRGQIVMLGTQDEVITPTTVWREYQFKCSPGDVTRRPCVITPYHYHLDWQIWFSGMRPKIEEEWLLRLAQRLLENDPVIRDMIGEHPFGADAPKYIKMDLYRYQFTGFPAWPEKWWRRELIGEYMPPVRLN